MFEILEKIIAILIADATLTAIIPAKSIIAGPVDIVTELPDDYLNHQINVHAISDISRSVPTNTRDTVIQIDIWSRNNMQETLVAYERIVYLLNYLTADEDQAHIFWERLDSAVDQYESDRRVWHRSMTIRAWSQKNN